MDPQVGRHIMEKCILGLLKNKCRVLVTHQLQHVKSIDNILLMVDGEVAHSGDFKSLRSSGIPFTELFNANRDFQANPKKTDDSVRSLQVRDTISSIGSGVNDKAPLMDLAPVKVRETLVVKLAKL